MKKLLLVLLVLIGLQSQTQAQVSWCDSLSYTTLPQQTLTVTGWIHFAGLSPNMLDSIGWMWGVCTNGVCYAGTGQTATFPNILPTDTIKVCYDAFVYSFDTIHCNYCDSLVYDQNTYSWVMFSMSNPTAINEVNKESIDWTGTTQGVYDLMGRKLKAIPTGTMYIRNNKLYITK